MELPPSVSKDVHEMMQAALGKTGVAEKVNMLLECLERPDYITVFSLEGDATKLDDSILNAVIKGMCTQYTAFLVEILQAEIVSFHRRCSSIGRTFACINLNGTGDGYRSFIVKLGLRFAKFQKQDRQLKDYITLH